jgi:hypothetical protein
MWSRLICVGAISFCLVPQAEAGEEPGVLLRASCTVIRYYVARYSASAAETWARSHGASEAEIDAGRRCLKGAPAHTAQAVNWIAR